MVRIALFGGSFDPIHIGHAMIANYVAQSELVDEVWLMPGRINPLKQSANLPADSSMRIDMCNLVADKCLNVKVCDVELHMPEPSYTCDTLARLRNLYPQHTFCLLIGSDNWKIFNRWKNYEEILKNHKILIFQRPEDEIDLSTLPQNVELLKDTPTAQISSTFIRQGFKTGHNMNFFVPADVLAYIKANNLYV